MSITWLCSDMAAKMARSSISSDGAAEDAGRAEEEEAPGTCAGRAEEEDDDAPGAGAGRAEDDGAPGTGLLGIVGMAFTGKAAAEADKDDEAAAGGAAPCAGRATAGSAQAGNNIANGPRGFVDDVGLEMPKLGKEAMDRLQAEWLPRWLDPLSPRHT